MRLVRFLIWILIIGIIGTGAYFGYIYFQGSRTEESPQPPNVPTLNGTTGGEFQLIASSQAPALRYWIFENNLYYLNIDGQVEKARGVNEETVNAAEIENVHALTASPDGAFALLSFGNPQSPQFSLFSVASNSWQPLAREIQSVSFSPDGTSLAYLEAAGSGIVRLTTNSLDLKKPKRILSLHSTDMEVRWVTQNTIALLEKPTALLRNAMWVVDVNRGTLGRVAERNGLLFQSSLYGGLRFSIVNGTRTLELTSADGKTVRRTLPFVTLPEKCAFTAQHLYCAAPQNLSQGVTLPDDYLKKQFYAVDTIYRYNLETSVVEELFTGLGKESVDATDLSVANNTLYFLNRYDSIVYAIKL